MRELRRGGLLAIIASCVALAVPAAASATDARGGYGAALDDVQGALDAMADAAGGPPGASALIQRGKRIRFLRSGVADLRNDRAFHRRDYMRIASVSKAYSGAVALSLVDQGLVELDDTLGELLPGTTPAAWSEVTLAQLMQHTSGVPSYTTSPEFLDTFGADPLHYFAPEDLVAYVADEPLLFAPGSAYRYSNTDNILIGLIAQEATGRVYANNLRQLVYRPLKLRQTSFPTDQDLPRQFIHGFQLEPGQPPEDVSEALSASGLWASGAIVATPYDLNRFVRGYAGGDLVSPASRRAQFTWVPGCGEPPGPGECSAGLSIYRYRTDCGTVFGHSGNLPGFTQLTAATKDGKRSFVISANAAIPDPSSAVFEHFNAANEAAICALSSRK